MNKYFLFFLLTIFAVNILGQTETRPVVCYYSDIKLINKRSSSQNMVHHIFAKGEKNENIYAEGRIKDGFFYADKIVGKKRNWFKWATAILKYNARTKLLKQFCVNALRNKLPNTYEDKIIVKYAVRNRGINKVIPLVLYDDPSNKNIALVVFGDSTSDSGNLKKWLKILPAHPYFEGRFSNGFIWSEYLEMMAHIPVQNWAMGGSISNHYLDLNYNLIPFYNSFGKKIRKYFAGNIKDQINLFKKVSLKNGKLKNPKTTLFSIWVGGNDYLAALNDENSANLFIDEPNDEIYGSNVVIRRTTRNIIRNIRNLYEMGARNFLVFNLPNLGGMPKVRQNKTYRLDDQLSNKERMLRLSTTMTDIILRHNHALEQEILRFKSEHPESLVLLIDIYKATSKIYDGISLENSNKFFKYDLDTNYHSLIMVDRNRSIRINRPCYNSTGYLGNQGHVCQAPEKTLLWDKVHPTTFAHCLLGFTVNKKLAKANLLIKNSLQKYLSLCRAKLIPLNE